MFIKYSMYIQDIRTILDKQRCFYKEEKTMEYQVSVRPWGNSLGIRIPKSVLKQSNIVENDTLSIEAKSDMILLKKVVRHRTFEERLAEYDGYYTAVDFDWGDPKGMELL